MSSGGLTPDSTHTSHHHIHLAHRSRDRRSPSPTPTHPANPVNNQNRIPLSSALSSSHSTSSFSSRSSENNMTTVASSNSYFPILVTTPQSARHEVLLIQPHWDFARLGKKICDAVTASPNCHSVHGNDPSVTHLSGGPLLPPGKIRVLKVRWSHDSQRDVPGWPTITIITSENHSAVLCMLWERVGAGRADVLEAEFSNWAGEEGLQAGGERLPTYREVGH